MKKYNIKPSAPVSGGVAGRQNSAAPVSGNANARYLVGTPTSTPTTNGGAYDNSELGLKGPVGQPVGTSNSRYMSAAPGGGTEAIGDARPLKTSGKASDVIGTDVSGMSFASSKPKRAGKRL